MMHYSSTLFLALMAFSVLSQTNGACAPGATDDITSLACSTETYRELCALLRETGLDVTLDGRSSSTQEYLVFAPDNTAFQLAGRLVGVNRWQKKETLNYHIYGNDDLECGTTRNSLLQPELTSITMCDENGVLVGQKGRVPIPRNNNDFPKFTGGDPPYLAACNGRIAGIGGVMGLGPKIYSYGTGCPFHQKSCKGSKGGQQKGGLNFNSINFYGKKGKGGKGGWNNFNRHQSIYAYNAYDAFGPYFDRYPTHYYYGKGGKKGKGRYRYNQPRGRRGDVNGYGNFRSNGGFGRGLEEVEVDDESYDASEDDDDAQVESRQLRQRSAYEPEEYVY